MATNSSVAFVKRRNFNGGCIRNEKTVRDGNRLNIVETATATLASPAHIDKDKRGVPALQYLELVRYLFPFEEHKFFFVTSTWI